MKRDRSLNNDQTQFSLKRVHLENEIICQNTKEEKYNFERNSIHLNSSDKRDIISKVQLWLNNITSTNKQFINILF
jgi:hypothetical protein